MTAARLARERREALDRDRAQRGVDEVWQELSYWHERGELAEAAWLAAHRCYRVAWRELESLLAWGRAT